MNGFFIRKALLFLCIGLATYSFAGTIKGKIADKKTGEPLVGATVTVSGKGGSFTSKTSLDGSYIFKKLPEGSYTVKIQFVGYTEFTNDKVILKSADDIAVVNTDLSDINTSLANITVNSKKSRESDEFARKTEHFSDNVVHIVSARAIEVSPDITVGNVLQRVSGVSVVRTNSGDGQYAIIRGMDQRYNYTTVNGIKIPSPNDKQRSIPMDIFPADMIERLEIVKAPTPKMEGDAIGGAMNLVMKDAPSTLTVNANLALGMSQVFLNRAFSGYSTSGIASKAPNEINGTSYVAKPADFSTSQLNYHNVGLPANTFAALSIGNRIFNKRLGFLLAGSFQSIYRGGNTTYYNSLAPGPDPANSPNFDVIQYRKYSNLQSRLGTHLKLDYAFNPDHKITLYNLFLQLDEAGHRSMLTVPVLPGPGEVHNLDRSQFTRKTVYNSTLSGTDRFTKDFALDWSLAYSLATSKTPDWVEMDLLRTDITSTTYFIKPVSHIWTHSRDEDKAAYLNLTYNVTKNFELAGGGMYRSKDRSNFYTQYNLSTVIPGGFQQVYSTINNTVFSFSPASNAIGDSTNGNNYSATEKVSAGYIQGKWNLKNLQILAGARSEHTELSYVSQLSSQAAGKFGTISYTDLLPSVHIKYAIDARQNLRASYYTAISRPSYFEYIPANITGDYYTESGNFNIKHTQSDNYDLRYENYFSATDHLFAGVFYKHLSNPIEYAFQQVSNNGYVYEPQNLGNATNYGFELVFSKYIRNWGLSGNYTYTHSAITTTKQVYGLDATLHPSYSYANQTRPLQGQSDHIGNLSLLYKNPKNGFDGQLSLVYTGKRINVVSPYLGLDFWQRATTQLDFSAEKKLNKRFTAFIKVTNLLNNPIIVDVLHANTLLGRPEQTDASKILVQKDVFNQTYMAGLRFKL